MNKLDTKEFFLYHILTHLMNVEDILTEKLFPDKKADALAMLSTTLNTVNSGFINAEFKKYFGEQMPATETEEDHNEETETDSEEDSRCEHSCSCADASDRIDLMESRIHQLGAETRACRVLLSELSQQLMEVKGGIPFELPTSLANFERRISKCERDCESIRAKLPSIFDDLNSK